MIVATLRVLASGIALLAALVIASAQAEQITTNPRIVVLPLADARLEEALRQGLRDAGLIEGQNIVIDWWRFPVSDENLKKLPTDLARSPRDAIVAIGSQFARPAMQSKAGPVVFIVGDPVMAGFAESLAKPGGIGTGISMVTTDLDAKRLELLKLFVPKAKRIASLGNPSNPLPSRARLESAAQSLGVELVRLDARNAMELDAALRAMVRKPVDGVLIAGDVLLLANKAKIAQAVRRGRLPAMFPWAEYHDVDVVASYGPNLAEGMRRAAAYVDKILKGAKPGDIPIEEVSKYQLIIDLRVARAMRLEVPQGLLLRADEVMR
jgi:putative ABC transport system substrate-binding protein